MTEVLTDLSPTLATAVPELQEKHVAAGFTQEELQLTEGARQAQNELNAEVAEDQAIARADKILNPAPEHLTQLPEGTVATNGLVRVFKTIGQRFKEGYSGQAGEDIARSMAAGARTSNGALAQSVLSHRNTTARS